MMQAKTLAIPRRFWRVHYDARVYPGAPEQPADRANCQVFAYRLLRQFGRNVPNLRSSELWADRDHSLTVTDPEPLDLIFFNRTANPFGAHLGVLVGRNRVLHLSKEVGTPAIWSFEEFALRPRYSITIGAKRVLLNNHVQEGVAAEGILTICPN